MILRYLELENFLSHEKVALSFPEEGVFLLSGESGAGKSSLIVDSVAFVLFGAVATRAKKGADLLRHSSSEMSVRASFDFDEGRRLVVSRGIDQRGASWAQVYQDGGEILAEGAAPVQRYLRGEMGGIVWQQFYAAFVARQSEISMLTSLRGAERKSLVQRMLGMRELQKAEQIIVEQSRRLGAEIGQLNSGVDILEEEKELKNQEQEVNEKRERLDKVEREVEDKEKELSNLDLLFSPLEKKRQSAMQAVAEKEEKGRLKESISALRATREDNQRALRAQADLPRLQGLLESAEEERDRLREIYKSSLLYAELCEKINKYEEEISNLQKIFGHLDPSEAIRRSAFVGGEAISTQKRLEEIEKSVHLLQESDTCPTCGQGVQNDLHVEKLLAERLEEIQTLKLETSELESERKFFAENEKQLERFSMIREKLLHEKEAIGNITIFEKDLENLLERGRAAGDKARELSEALEEAQFISKKYDPKAENNLEQAKKRLSEIEDTEEGDYDDQEYNDMRAKITSLKQEIDRGSGALPEIKKQIAEQEKSIANKKKDLSGKKAEIQALEKARASSDDLQKIQAFLRAYQKHLAHEIRPALEEIGSEMLRRISAGKHVAMHIDDNYEIELENENGGRLSASMISGGESIRANICLRLALTRLVSQRTGVPLGMLVLDEPLPSQDPGHIERIMELLDSLRPFYPQQFIISHVGDLRSTSEVDYLIDFDEKELMLTTT